MRYAALTILLLIACLSFAKTKLNVGVVVSYLPYVIKDNTLGLYSGFDGYVRKLL